MKSDKFEIRNHVLVKYDGIFDTSAEIPDKVTCIGENAFETCTRLKHVTIPDSVTSIEDNAFYDCIALEEIIIPDSVTYIASDVFHDCRNLRYITLQGVRFDIWHFYEKYQEDYMFQLMTFFLKDDMLNLLVNGNFGDEKDSETDMCFMPDAFKYELISAVLMKYPKNEICLSLLEKHFQPAVFQELVSYLIDKQLLTKDIIDRYIRLAIDNKQYDEQIMLINYKKTYIGYDSVEETIRKKFEL